MRASLSDDTRSARRSGDDNRWPPLGVADRTTVLRERYPEALVCVECGLLLATRPESYRRSSLTTTECRAYVCAQCRLEMAAAAQLAAVRIQNLAVARAARSQAVMTIRDGMREPFRESLSDADFQYNKISPANVPQVRRGRARRPGRPRAAVPVDSNVRRQRQRDYQRTYRQRQKASAPALA
jgi:hypothetical protein